jgi:hypothetical protein
MNEDPNLTLRSFVDNPVTYVCGESDPTGSKQLILEHDFSYDIDTL